MLTTKTRIAACASFALVLSAVQWQSAEAQVGQVSQQRGQAFRAALDRLRTIDPELRSHSTDGRENPSFVSGRLRAPDPRDRNLIVREYLLEPGALHGLADVDRELDLKGASTVVDPETGWTDIRIQQVLRGHPDLRQRPGSDRSGDRRGSTRR